MIEKKRIRPTILVTLILLIGIVGALNTLPTANASTLYENYNTGDDAALGIYGAIWAAQTFTVGAAGHTITSVKLLLYRYGSPGTVTVSIRATDGNGHPTGSDLTSGTTDGNTLPTGSPSELREITLIHMWFHQAPSMR